MTGTGAYQSTKASEDVVGVFDGYDQVFRAARPMSASVREEAKLMEHPLESGATVTDHLVIQPVGIELTMMLEPDTYRDTYKEIKTLFLAGKILKVQTKTDSYENQIIEALPHEEDPEIFDTIALTLRLREITIITAEYRAAYKAQRPAQSNTAARGDVQPVEQKKGSWIAGVIKE